MAEQRAFNPLVEGSNPSGRTNYIGYNGELIERTKMNNEAMTRLETAFHKLHKAIDDDNKCWRRRQAMKLSGIVLGSAVAGFLTYKVIEEL